MVNIFENYCKKLDSNFGYKRIMKMLSFIENIIRFYRNLQRRGMHKV